MRKLFLCLVAIFFVQSSSADVMAVLMDTNYSYMVSNVFYRSMSFFGVTVQTNSIMVVDNCMDRSKVAVDWVRMAALVQRRKLVIVSSNYLNMVWIDINTLPLAEFLNPNQQRSRSIKRALVGPNGPSLSTNIVAVIGRTNYYWTKK